LRTFTSEEETQMQVDGMSIKTHNKETTTSLI
jgi:hypothetical protein